MRILVIGSGGREHALAWAIARSPRATKLFVAPGNGGTAKVAENVALDVSDAAAVVAFVRAEQIGLVVVGPEQPAVDGIVDALRAAGIATFGPSQAAAELEGSKALTKLICDEANVPTARYGHFEDEASALAYIRKQGAPIVIKADGLAAGKGVTVAMSLAEAETAVRDCFSGAFGTSGHRVVIEEFLDGEEASVFALCDGQAVVLLPAVQDHKRVGTGDTGPNTGGMGAYSPAPVITREIAARIENEIILPTVRRMAERGTPFTGVLFAGIMVTRDGPKLIEYNVRFGDPECQVLMLRLQSDAVDMLEAVATGTLLSHAPRFRPEVALTVVMAAEGYPGTPKKGTEITGADALDSETLVVFHAGTKRDGERLLANGGRVLNVTALGSSAAEAQARAYAAIALITWPEGFCRSDIGWRAIAREMAQKTPD